MGVVIYLNRPNKQYEPCEHCGGTGKVEAEGNTIRVGGTTHNLAQMADEAGIFKALWYPQEIGLKTGGDAVAILKAGLKRLEEKPEFFRKFNAKNGWGKYEDLVELVGIMIELCEKHPDYLLEADP